MDNRIEAMKKYREEENRKAEEKAKTEARELERSIELVKRFKPRIEKLLETANECEKYGICIDKYGAGFNRSLDSWEKGTFVSNSISHKLGFIGYMTDKGKEYLMLGIKAGGACGCYDFITNGNLVLSEHEKTKAVSAPLQKHLKQFLQDFDKFESKFYEYVDGIVSQPLTEEQSKKPFKVHITETFSRNVIIYAEDEFEASEIAEELCNESVIDITSADDFGDRHVDVLGTPDEIDLKELRRYERR